MTTETQIINTLSTKFNWDAVSKGWYNEDMVTAVDVLINDCGATMAQAIKYVQDYGTDVYYLRDIMNNTDYKIIEENESEL